MGGGNGQKSRMARERNAEKNKAAKGSQLDTNKKAMSIQVDWHSRRTVLMEGEHRCVLVFQAAKRTDVSLSWLPQAGAIKTVVYWYLADGY
uniref:Small EDRK-rich factor-like N-terminal domain-containing protein n=1 Tax=Setaria viridis TaxID=4556 RepID=A0A4U6T3Y8_SETVI|nr:hypothetical protein SEVIR_9G362700v2 [Setaria viridis]